MALRATCGAYGAIAEGEMISLVGFAGSDSLESLSK
jgi:hypothetical protein